MLTREERGKFAAWCEMEAKSDDLMSTQLAKMGLRGVEEALEKRMRQRAAAFSIVALELRRIEDMEVGA